MRTFLVEMDDEKCCDLSTTGRMFFCQKREFFGGDCIGDLNNRPEWCPLVQVSEFSLADIVNTRKCWCENEQR